MTRDSIQDWNAMTLDWIQDWNTMTRDSSQDWNAMTRDSSQDCWSAADLREKIFCLEKFDFLKIVP